MRDYKETDLMILFYGTSIVIEKSGDVISFAATVAAKINKIISIICNYYLNP